MNVKRGIVLTDLQYPLHNPKLLKNVERYMMDEHFDYLIYLGDFMDMDAISHHAIEAGNQRSLEGKRLKKDYEEMSEILRRHRGIVTRRCKVYYFMGNHEEWASKFVDKYPMLEGMIEPENNLPFKELGIEVVAPRKFVKLGKIHFIHGDIWGGGYVSANHAKKMVETFNRNVVYGHHHTLQAHTKLSPVGIDETHTAYCLPCLADTQPEWAKDRPTPWLNGFGVFSVTNDNFSIFPVVAINGSFQAPNWKEYS